MQELAGRLAALDPDATAAVRVIAYFDELAEGRAGVEAIVRGAAVLAGCPARLVDEDRHLRVRVDPDGRRDDRDDPADPRWPSTPVTAGGSARLWLERDGADGPVVPMVLERAAATARTVLMRTRARQVAGRSDDPAMVELVLDASAPEPDRRHAARVLGLADGSAYRAVALGDPEEACLHPEHGVLAPGRRVGVGPAVPVGDLPASWAAARTALRFAADGTPEDPGPRVVHAEALGGPAVLASAVSPGSTRHPDVDALDRAGADAPWVLGTLHAVAYSSSLRSAAVELTLHHSTLQDRLARAEHLLGWTVREPEGRLRLQVSFLLRRLHRHG